MDAALALRAAHNGDDVGAFKVASFCSSGLDAPPAAAADADRTARARAADAPARVLLGHDVRRAVRWYRRAAQSGFAPAMAQLADAHSTGAGGVRRDLRLAFEWLERAVLRAAQTGDTATNGL